MHRISLDWTDLAGVLICTCFFVGWCSVDTHSVPVRVVAVFAILFIICVLGGATVLRLLLVNPRIFGDFPSRLLFGLMLFNTSLFLVTATTRVSVLTGSLILMLLTLLGVVLARLVPTDTVQEPSQDNSKGGLLCVVVILVSTTLWCQDCFSPISYGDDVAVLKPWVDASIHSIVIKMVSEAQGLSSLQNPFMAGMPANLYHYASYMLPALICSGTGMHSFHVYNAVQVPMGLFLTGIAAYVLVNSRWGAWAGFAASLGLHLIPNAAYHGFMNPWFSYHWLISVSPSLGYGIAMATLSWVLMFEGIRTNRCILVAAAYVLAGGILIFKAQIFVANALICLLYPWLFWRPLSVKFRIIATGASVAVFFSVIKMSQQFDSIPFMSIDFSAVHWYVQWILAHIENEWVRHLLSKVLTFDSWIETPEAVLLIFFGTFGLFGLAYPVLAVAIRHKADRDFLLFPFLVITVYMVMSVGLALDKNAVGTPEELLHRPFVWAYFVVCSWVAGGFFWGMFGDSPPTRRFSQGVAALLLLSLFLVPFFLGKKVQIGPLFGRSVSWMSVPTGWVRSAFFIRDNSERGDIIQDSKNDPIFITSALSERHSFASFYPPRFEMLSSTQKERVARTEGFKAFSEEENITRFAADNSIKWYILHPDDTVLWPGSILDKPVFTKGGFRVYRFSGTNHTEH